MGKWWRYTENNILFVNFMWTATTKSFFDLEHLKLCIKKRFLHASFITIKNRFFRNFFTEKMFYILIKTQIISTSLKVFLQVEFRNQQIKLKQITIIVKSFKYFKFERPWTLYELKFDDILDWLIFLIKKIHSCYVIANFKNTDLRFEHLSIISE